MFEVSNKFVDDVIRLEDDFNRPNGRIEVEHQVPAVLIMAAGLGTRLKHHTVHKHKALVSVGSQAAISRVISKFPAEYDVVVATGHQAESLEEYCITAHPERRFRFVRVTGWDDPKTDPGHSVWQCRDLLQCPFFLVAPDSLVQESPHMEGDWIGVHPTDSTEKYATVQVTDGRVASIVNKGPAGFDHAFVGWAAVYNYKTFWTQLGKTTRHELISAWADVSVYPALMAKNLSWFDVGNLDDLAVARRHYGDSVSSPKSLDETTYRVGSRVLKFHPDPQVSHNRFLSGERLGSLAPANLKPGTHFISYDWKAGSNLYEHDSIEVYRKFLVSLGHLVGGWSQIVGKVLVQSFYREKTEARVRLLVSEFGAGCVETPYTVNGTEHRSLNALLTKLDYEELRYHPFYAHFHGDLHPDNVIYDGSTFTYVDWRESFGGRTDGGDLYYDLGKLYAGILVDFDLLKRDDTVEFQEGSFTLNYRYATPDSLRQFKGEYETWLQDCGFPIVWVKLIAGLAYLNIAPLHGPVWGKVLLAKAIELLDEVIV
jgi:choline kinase